MGLLHDWMARSAAAKAAGEAEQRLSDEYRDIIDAVSEYDLTERNTEKDVQRRYQIYGKLLGEEIEEPRVPTPFQQKQIREERKTEIPPERYRQINTQWVEWCKHVLSNRIMALEYDEFNEYTAARALVRLLAYTERWTWNHNHHMTFIPGGARLLASLYEEDEYDSLPDPLDIQQFLEQGGMEIAEYQTFLATLYSEVPGSRRAVSRLLGAYGQLVRDQWANDAEADDTPLPHEEVPRGSIVTWDSLVRLFSQDRPDHGVMDFQERAMEAAITEYIQGASLRRAADHNGVIEESLRAELDRIGILRSPGRPKKRR